MNLWVDMYSRVTAIIGPIYIPTMTWRVFSVAATSKGARDSFGTRFNTSSPCESFVKPLNYF